MPRIRPNPWRRRAAVGVLLAALLVSAFAALAATGRAPAGASQQPATGELKCRNPKRAWAEIASAPNSFAIGNCPNGTRYYRVRHSNAHQSRRGWEIGRITGNFDGCGVVKRNESKVVHGDTRTSDCLRDPSQARKMFASVTDCEPEKGLKRRRCRWDPNAHGDFETKVLTACPIFANVRPFSLSSRPTDPVGTIVPDQKRYRFRMRYITRDGQFALGFLGHPRKRNSQVSPAPRTMPQWVFVDADCITKPHMEGLGDDVTDR